MSEAAQRMIRQAQGYLYGTLSHLLTKSHNSKSIFEWYLEMLSYNIDAKMNEINEKLESLKWDHVQNPLTGKMIFGEGTSRAIYKMDCVEFFESKHTSSTIQCLSCL